MKSQTLPVKRRPVPKGIFRRLSAVTINRKQRVAAAAAPAAELDADDGGSKISRALTIIFLIHIVAIGLIFIHQRFLDGRPGDKSAKSNVGAVAVATALPATPQRTDLPRVSAGEKIHVVRAGDNYARIAAAEGVDESDLRLLNKHVDIGPGLLLKIPPKRIVALDPKEVTEIREQTPSDHDRGLVEAVPVDVAGAPKARLVHPTLTHGTLSQTAHPASTTVAATVAPSKKSYVVQPGDSVWKIASRFKISKDALMHANGISDAHKMKTGMKLVIP